MEQVQLPEQAKHHAAMPVMQHQQEHLRALKQTASLQDSIAYDEELEQIRSDMQAHRSGQTREST